MLRSTGFFRGIDCPFYSEYCKGKSDKDECKRPYCHFRHSKQRRASYAASDARNPEELNSKHKEQGYDPFNPDVVRPKDQGNGDSGTASADLGVLELELVNRAIAEVRNEVEREKRKLSRIGDEEYIPTASSAKGAKKSKTVSEEYEPTFGSAKGAKRSKTVSEEYEPTSSPAKGAKRSKTVSEEYEPSSTKGANRSRTVSEEYEPTFSSAKGANRSKTVSEEYEPTSSSTKGANRSKTVSEEYEPSSTKGANRSKTVSEEYEPSSTKGANRSRTVSEEYEPTVTSLKAGAKRPKTIPEEYDPTTSLSRAGSRKPKTSHLAYDPGSYQINSTADYNPTPCASKYTLDSDGQDNRASSLEYVPTSVCRASVKKPSPRVQTPQLPSPPPSPKSSNAPSSKSKYSLDHSKPSTDLEYDPLSNYSAKLAGKNKKEDAAKGEGNRKPKLSGDEEYVPTAMKAPRSSADAQKYTLSLSESDGEASGAEYRPTSLSRLQRRRSSTGAADDLGAAGQMDRARDTPGRSKPRSLEPCGGKEDPEPGLPDDCKNQETGRRKHKTEDDKVASKSSNAKSGKTEKVLKADKDAGKKSSGGNKEKGTGDKGDGRKTNVSKKPSQQGSKKDGRSEGRREDEKSKTREKSVNKCGRDEKRNDGGGRKTEKVKSDSSRRDKEREKGGDCKKVKSLDRERERDPHKHKEPRNGQLDGGRKEKEVRKCSKGAASGGATRGRSSSDEARKSSRDGRAGKVKRRSLSHADLFGAESAEESEEEEEEEDDEEEGEKLVRRSAAAIKRRGANKRKASELTPSSSEDEDGGVEDERADEDFSSVDFSTLQVDLDFDSDPMEECLRIFNESKHVKMEDKGRQAKQPSKDSEDEEDSESTLTTLFPGQKKRVSHFSAKGNTDAAPKPAPYRRLTAQEICYRRMQIAQQQAVQLAAAVKTASASPSLSPSLNRSPKPSFPGERKRVAHRPSPLTSSSKPSAVEAKPAANRVMSPARTLPGRLSVKAHTSAGIQSKTTTTFAQKRVAHTPTMKSTAMKRPVIPTEFGARVPTNVRQRYLNTFIDECVKFCPTEDLAFQMALDEEKVVYERSSSKNIYLNVAVNTLKKLRSNITTPSSPAAKSPAVRVGGNRKALSHEELLGGRLAAKTSFTLNRTGRQQEEKLMGAALYRKLREYLMTEEQLQEHSYPRPHPEGSGRALVHNVPEKKNTDPFSKVCCRCGAEYKLNVNGACVRKEECHHHWGRLRRHKVSGGWETNYNCCSGAVGTTGCQVGKQHVQDGRKESLDGYVTTFDKSLPPDGNGGVFALDCEMCYTVLGLELTRVTVINSELKVIYDTFVKPESRVVDYNTRFSGVTEEDLENATITLRDVQAVLLSMFSSESILIGHSLESDLFALKLIHSTVVDTAIVFPHRLGLPYKRALRNLMADHLKRIIQDNVGGHDSSEDARACMELMTWKIKEDAKVKR
ncbi:RNA exonuclease 1 homolog [Osmerus eperlanus]|uniref:RNA exonuclease 1 homolog n=1 Tax=Osmerus eperlanus TaxID=29151 RepID=UPI002E13F4BA